MVYGSEVLDKDIVFDLSLKYNILKVKRNKNPYLALIFSNK